MIKVSFKKSSYKKVERFNDKVTIVTLTGIMHLPENLESVMPKGFMNWLYNHTNPTIVYTGYKGNMTITAKGKAIRSDKDKDNPVLAERIAESKAKLKIYSFIHSFISKYILEYNKLMTGKNDLMMHEGEVTDDSLFGMADKYQYFITTEKEHLESLISQS